MLDLDSIKVYFKPFEVDGTYSSTWLEVSDYVTKIGNLKQDIDSADYQLGVFKNSSLSLEFENRTGKFNDIDSTKSIFKYKRSDTQVKILYKKTREITECGCAITGMSYLAEELEIFKGLLNDDAYRQDANTERITLKVLGLDSLFDRTEVPYASISSGDLCSAVIYTCLNQTAITSLLTVSSGNIVCGNDKAIDDKTEMENETVADVLDDLLLASNSVLYIKDDTVYVADRTESASSQKTFYGQGSPNGIENIISLKDMNNGFHRLFNYFAWKDTSEKQSDTDSVTKYGVKRKEIAVDYFTNTTNINSMLSSLLAEFKDPKQELNLTTKLDYAVFALNLLDKVNIDYPTIYVEGEAALPICGVAVCGVGVLPDGLWSLTIDSATDFKILSKSYNLDKMEVTFKLREV